MKSIPNDVLNGASAEIEVIRDPYSIQRLYANLVQSAKKEILLFLPSTSAFLREEKIGIIQSLQRASRRGITVRVLTPAEDKIQLEPALLFQDKNTRIPVRHIRHNSSDETSKTTRTKIILVDRKEYLIVELKDDSKETFVEAVRSAIYSATVSTVNAYLTLFESLWDQAELYDQLEAHDKLQKEFINIAAHELRTPIQPIIGMTEILRLGFEDGSETSEITREELDILVRNATRLERLATDILEVSRIESQSLKLNKEKFDINEKIRNIIIEAKTLSLSDKKLEFQYKTNEHIFVEADKTRIFEVISNLIRNAIKFTKEGTIAVKAERKDGIVQIEVKDSGVGIDREIMPRLFTKFATKSDQGTGLGLYISQKIIEAHGGRIWARNNEDGNGATFSFTLPLA